MENLIERIENDFKNYLDTSECIIDYDFEWNNGKINFNGWKDLYLEYIDYTIDNEYLLDIFATTDRDLICKTFNDNIKLFDEIVKAKYQEVGEQYYKMTIRDFWEQNAEIDYYDVDYKKVLNKPLHYCFLEIDDIPKEKVEELILHINNNCELLEFVMTEDEEGDIAISNANGFSEWYDDDCTMGELFDDIYKHCSLYVKNYKKELVVSIKDGIEDYGEYEIHLYDDGQDEEYLKELLNDYSLKYYYSNDYRTIYITQIKTI